jgi:Tol biopolymer transport system component
VYESRAGSWDLWLLPFSGNEEPFPFADAAFDERQGQFSPDGKWISYTSDESGDPEIYVQPFPPSGEQWQVSTGGGTDSRWRADGRELFYLAQDQALMAVDVDPNASSFQFGTLEKLFETGIRPYGGAYDVTGDGQRFLITTITQERSSITVVLNWTAELER